MSTTASPAQLFGKVVGVADGDTVTVLEESDQQHKVRLAGIDAPERRQAYGDRAKQHLSALVYGRAVVVVWDKRDRYGRIVGRVLARKAKSTSTKRTRLLYCFGLATVLIVLGMPWPGRAGGRPLFRGL